MKYQLLSPEGRFKPAGGRRSPPRATPRPPGPNSGSPPTEDAPEHREGPRYLGIAVRPPLTPRCGLPRHHHPRLPPSWRPEPYRRFRRGEEGSGAAPGRKPERLRRGRCRKAAGGGGGSAGPGRGGGRAAGRDSSKMLPTTSVNSRSQGNGALSPRDAARHTAGAKRYKYLRRLFHFRQMDFEFALWQMLYLFTSPQRVYRNFHYRKQTKDQWARDDPAFLVLLSIWLCVSTVGFGFVLDMGFFETIKLLLWVVFIDCVGVGLLIATLMWFISNKYLVKQQNRDYDVEWGYAFDVHLNAFYPLLVILHFIQLFFINYVIISDSVIGYFVGNTLWLIAIGYYIYVTFLGYSALPFLKNTAILLYPFALLIMLYLISLACGWNFTKMLCSFYKYRVK